MIALIQQMHDSSDEFERYSEPQGIDEAILGNHPFGAPHLLVLHLDMDACARQGINVIQVIRQLSTLGDLACGQLVHPSGARLDTKQPVYEAAILTHLAPEEFRRRSSLPPESCWIYPEGKEPAL